MKTTNSLCQMEPDSPRFQENVMVLQTNREQR